MIMIHFKFNWIEYRAHKAVSFFIQTSKWAETLLTMEIQCLCSCFVQTDVHNFLVYFRLFTQRWFHFYDSITHTRRHYLFISNVKDNVSIVGNSRKNRLITDNWNWRPFASIFKHSAHVFEERIETRSKRLFTAVVIDFESLGTDSFHGCSGKSNARVHLNRFALCTVKPKSSQLKVKCWIGKFNARVLAFECEPTSTTER